jgi:hypothetical protein
MLYGVALRTVSKRCSFRCTSAVAESTSIFNDSRLQQPPRHHCEAYLNPLYETLIRSAYTKQYDSVCRKPSVPLHLTCNQLHAEISIHG